VVSLFAGTLRHDGVIEANRVSRDDQGRVRLQASDGVSVGGRISATGQGVRGGDVTVTGADVVLAAAGIDVSGDEAILKDGSAVGYISSGGYAHRVGRSMAMGYVTSENAAPGTALQVEILGEMYEAKVLGAPIYDPNGANMRC
jgi:glycine cleavage system aminomethyltransferase T